MNQDEKNSTSSQESQNKVVSDDKVNDAQSDESLAQVEQFTKEDKQEERSFNKNDKEQASDDVEAEQTWHNKNALKRGIAMLGFGFLAGFVRLGISFIAVFQFLSLLFAEKPNKPLVKFGQNLNTYLYQINQFLTVNSEMYPFPFTDWPDSAPK